ncbi:MAG: phosphotransferase enzyme family protein [Elusimicrobia bacterium CG11_big_fil_rev_8_21_14_0_20_64_6]|nr:MAG: phosphotransferase enzyme family protein [Elusimicrobia bacterium CG11_big_fil_rev_8_21_14_0_20_64_6]
MADPLDVLRLLFREKFGADAATLVPVRAEGSNRRIYRLAGKGTAAIGVLNEDSKENRAFIEFSRHFHKEGIPVPEFYAENKDATAYLEQDLGDTTLFQFLGKRRTAAGFPAEVVAAYQDVVRWLPKMQITAGVSIDDRWCYPRKSFDKQSMLWDLNYFKYYFLTLGGIMFHEEKLEEDFQVFADYLLAADREYFLSRDFQSRNVMLKDGKPYFIDYQGGRRGALHYDIASLLYDAKADVPFELRDELLELYISEASKLTTIDKIEFKKLFPGFVLVRIMQAMGAYGLRGFHEKKPLFLQSIPYAIRNIERVLITSGLPIEVPELMNVFKRLVGSSALRQFGSAKLKLTVRIQSFSYKNGMPKDQSGHGGGYVLDCRCLPNPGRIAEYKSQTGLDGPVIAYLSKEDAVDRWARSAFSVIDQAVEDYGRRNFTGLFVAFGCTGGQHRSVYMAERLAKHLRDQGVSVVVSHREKKSWTKK